MSLLINDMEMPKRCFGCPMMSFIGSCNVNSNYSIKPFNAEGKHPDCPLVEIPTPHGRLIDVDRLLPLIESECNENCKGCEDGCCAEDRFDFILSAIKNAPTVIESEVSK